MNNLNFAFARSDQILPILHIFSAVFLTGYQIGVVMRMKKYHKDILDDDLISQVLSILKSYQIFFITIFSCSVISGLFMGFGSSYKFADPMVSTIVATKSAIACFILFNFLYIHYKILQLKNSITNSSQIEISEYIIIISKYFIPLNITLEFFAIYLGVVMRGF